MHLKVSKMAKTDLLLVASLEVLLFNLTRHKDMNLRDVKLGCLILKGK